VFPLAALEALLKSADEAHALLLSEDRYWLVHGWFAHQEAQGNFRSPEETRAAFARLLRALPFERMHRRFVSDVVMKAADVQALDGEGWAIMSSVISNSNFARPPPAPNSLAYRHRSIFISMFGEKIRADVRFPGAVCRGLVVGGSRYAAVLLGFPLVIKLCKNYSGTVNLECGLALPDRQVAQPSAAQRKSEALSIDVKVSLAEAEVKRVVLGPLEDHSFLPGDDKVFLARDVMGQRWDEAFKEGSRFLDTAKDELVLRVQVTVNGAKEGHRRWNLSQGSDESF
jgi:hypothetical protein